MKDGSGKSGEAGTMLQWRLYGAGFANLGRNGCPEQVAIPQPGPDELLVRCDACGLCFSDTKVIALGADHPRLAGRNLAADPVTLGHELICTVIEVGAHRAAKFARGERYVVQADIFYQRRSMAFGYVFRGGLSQYALIPAEALDGDEGCYLLPVAPHTGYVEAALTEPWACVVAAYEQRWREQPAAAGRMLVVDDGSVSADRIDLTAIESAGPSTVVTIGASTALLDRLVPLCGAVECRPLDSPWTEELIHGGQARFDDMLLIGVGAAVHASAAGALLADRGMCILLADQAPADATALDVGRIHYNCHRYVAAAPEKLGDAWLMRRTAHLQPGGSCLIIGAGGPMGQMHLQRAIDLAEPPTLIVGTEMNAPRLAALQQRYSKLAASRGIRLVLIAPPAPSHMKGLAGTAEFDDVVCMAAAPEAVAEAARFLAPSGWLNIFAGVARGTMAHIALEHILAGARIIGSSGSALADMRQTLEYVESGKLNSNRSLAAIGGMEAAGQGLADVKAGRFAGKALIFPHISGLEMTSLEQLESVMPTVAAKLDDGMFWTHEAERELFRVTGAPQAEDAPEEEG